MKVVSEVAYAIFNMCGFINWMQRYQQGLPGSEPKEQKFEKINQNEGNDAPSPDKVPRKDSVEKKKRALNYLDDEIKQFTKK